MNLIQFVPSETMVIDPLPTHQLADTCLTFLNLGLGKIVYVTDLTFSTEETHPMTQLFFLIVAFTVALPFTLLGLVFKGCSSSNDKMYQQFEDALDVGSSLKLKQDTPALIEKIVKNENSLHENYQLLVKDFSSLKEISLWRHRLFVLHDLSKEENGVELNFKPSLSILSRDQFRQALADNEKPSLYETGVVETRHILQIWLNYSLTSEDETTRRRAYYLMNSLPLLDAKALLEDPETAIEANIQTDLKNLLTLCGKPLFCADLKINLCDLILNHKYATLPSDLLNVASSFTEEINHLLKEIEHDLNLTIDLNENGKTPSDQSFLIDLIKAKLHKEKTLFDEQIFECEILYLQEQESLKKILEKESPLQKSLKDSLTKHENTLATLEAKKQLTQKFIQKIALIEKGSKTLSELIQKQPLNF